VFYLKIQLLRVSRQDAKAQRKPSRFDLARNPLRLGVLAGKAFKRKFKISINYLKNQQVNSSQKVELITNHSSSRF
jgi:hypothetical protein